MAFASELDFEKHFIDLLTNSCGWEEEVIRNPTEEDLIKNWADILYNNNKETDVLNGHPLTDGEISQIITQINRLKTPLNLNRFVNGKTVSIKRDNPKDNLHFGKFVSLKIYDRDEIAGGKSKYQVVEQPKFKTNNSVYPARRGDVMLLINGMPLFHIELKRYGIPISQAQKQIEEYMDNGVFTGIFALVQIFVTMNPDDAVYYANPGTEGKFNSDYYFHWEDFNNDVIAKWDEFTKAILSIPTAHQLIGYYTIPDDSDGLLKVMRSYQYYAASNIYKRVLDCNWTKIDQHGGYVWHTTGSGKTMTSFKAAELISNAGKADKVVFLLDRIELGEQSLSNYKNFAEDADSVQATENTQTLVSKLTSNDNDKTLIVTSIQKMSRITENGDVGKTDLKRIQAKRIVFIIDECHRDQSGDMHQAIKSTFPNAIYFGFSGTPIHGITSDIFGDELHRYAISHGIRDKNVLGFDPYKVLTFDDKDMRKAVALRKCGCKTSAEAMANPHAKNMYLYYMGKTSPVCTMLEIEKEVPKEQYTDAKFKHKETVVEDILSEWEVRSVCSKFHAIFATSSIKEAIEYYQLFKAKNSVMRIATVFDPSDSNTSMSIEKMHGITEILMDYEKMFGNKYEIGSYASYKKDVCARLAHKKPYINLQNDERIDLVIVVDQLLTGFDSKWINTLYLDKVLHGKELIQAISRTNRLFGRDKPHGTVIWYRYPHTMEQNLEAAVKEYSGDKAFGIFVDKLNINLTKMNLIYADIKDLFESYGIENFSHNYEDVDWKKKFAKAFQEFNRILDSAKIQGFRWNQLTYSFAGNVKITLDLDEKAYLVLVLRYKELFTLGPKREGIPYDIDTRITEIHTDSIDDDFINSRFKIYVKNLKTGDEKLKEKALQDLHNSFATLSVEDQEFANMFLTDLQSGNVEVIDDKDLTDFIIDYKNKLHNNQIHTLCENLGIDETKLRNLMDLRPDESSLNVYARFDELIDTLDIMKACFFFEQIEHAPVSKRQAKTKSYNMLKRFILEDGFNIFES